MRDNVYGDSIWDGRYGGVDPEPTDFADQEWLEQFVPLDRNGNSDESKELKQE